MKGFKRNVSYDINKILEMFKSGETSMSRLTRNQFDINKEKKINFDIYHNILKQKYGEKYPMFPQFKWQRGYNYQIVETKERFKFYKDYYIPTNPKKHNVMEDWWNYPWSSINNKMFN